MATVVSYTRLSITFYVHCLSCYDANVIYIYLHLVDDD